MYHVTMTTKKKPKTAAEIGRMGWEAMRRKTSKKQYRENCKKGGLAKAKKARNTKKV